MSPAPPPALADALACIRDAEQALEDARSAASDAVAAIGRGLVPGAQWTEDDASSTAAAAAMRYGSVVVSLMWTTAGWRAVHVTLTFWTGSASRAYAEPADALEDVCREMLRRAGPAPWGSSAIMHREFAHFVLASLGVTP